MKRRLLFALVATTALALPSVAWADVVDDVVDVLTRQGYSDIDVMRTLLGRTRILARNEQGTRELVVNPRTGEVLRDVWTTLKGDKLPPVLSEGHDGDDDDHDDDNDHGDRSGSGHGGDDDHDDNSGKGSSNDD